MRSPGYSGKTTMLRYDECVRSLMELDQREAALLKAMLQEAKNSIVRISEKFRSTITDDPASEFAGWGCVHSPFPRLCVELEGGFIYGNHRCELIVYACGKNRDALRPQFPWMLFAFALGRQLDDPNQIFAYPVIFKYFDPEGVPQPAPVNTGESWRSLDGVARNILDFLCSPSMRIELEPGMDKINRSRRRRGKPPLTDYHIIKWSTHSLPATTSGQGSKHRVRYDVRGHFATYTCGPLTGRRIWRPAHQRGLANDLFRPKGYQR